MYRYYELSVQSKLGHLYFYISFTGQHTVHFYVGRQRGNYFPRLPSAVPNSNNHELTY